MAVIALVAVDTALFERIPKVTSAFSMEEARALMLSAVSSIRVFKRVASFRVILSSCTPDVVYTLLLPEMSWSAISSYSACSLASFLRFLSSCFSASDLDKFSSAS